MNTTRKDITENWKEKVIARGLTERERRSLVESFSATEAQVNERFSLKWFVVSLPWYLRPIVSYALRPWFVERDRETASYLDADGIHSWAEVEI